MKAANGRATIPEEVLLPHLNKMISLRRTTVVNMVVYDLETIRRQCGSEYAGVPIDDLRSQAENMRKANKCVTTGGHAPAKLTPPPPEYQEYLQSEHWLVFAKKVREFWGWRCAMCNAKATGTRGLDVHHRHYDSVHREQLTDCIAVCRKCHKVADVRRKWLHCVPEEQELFA